MKNPTVEQLRKNNYRVRVLHERYSQSSPEVLVPRKEIAKGEALGKGGRTTVEITTPEGKELTGVAKCHLNDSFNRRRALAIAVGRALKSE